MPKNILVKNFACLSFTSELPTWLLLPEKMQKMECYHEMNKYEKLFYGKKKVLIAIQLFYTFVYKGKIVKERESWHAPVHGVAKSWT